MPLTVLRLGLTVLQRRADTASLEQGGPLQHPCQLVHVRQQAGSQVFSSLRCHVCLQVAYVRLPTPPNPWRKPAPKKQQQGQQQQQDQQQQKQEPPKQEGQDQQQQQEQQEGAGQQDKVKSEAAEQQGAPAAAGAKAPTTAAQRQQQQGLPAGYQQMTAKQRRQLKRRQDLAARAAERDSWSIARAACLCLVEQKLNLHGRPLAFDAAMGQVRVGS